MTKLRSPLGGSPEQAVLATLQDVIERLDKIEPLSKGRRGDLRCAVRRMAAAIGPAPSDIPVNLPLLQQHLEGFEPAAHGMTPKRWSTIKSDFQSALRLTGLAEPLRTSKATLSPAWSALLASVAHRHHSTALSRFARFCSMHEVEPEDVDDVVFARFADALKRQMFVRKPGMVLRGTAHAWNTLCGSGGFSGRPLMLPSNRPKPQRVALDDLPESFVQDLDRYCRWCAVADVLDDTARPRALRPITIAGNRDRIRSAVTAAIDAGVPKETITSLATLVELETFKKILRRRHDMAGGKANAQAQSIATLLKIIAREWVKLSPEKIEELKRLRSKLPRLKSGLTSKNQALVDRFEDPALEARFLALPYDLWKEAKSGRLKPYKALIHAQLALAILIEQILGLRSLNLISLSFSKHLSWPAGPRGPVLLRIEGGEMKAGIEHNAELPARIGRMLLYYRDHMVPAAIGQRSDAVFVNRFGKPKTQRTLAGQFQAIIRRRLGITMSLHQNRHLGANRLLDANPGAYETARQWLGHQNLKTTVNTYGGVDTKRAVRHNAMLIERRREATRHLLKRRSRTRSKKEPQGQSPSPPNKGE